MKTLLLPYLFLDITTATDLNMISYLFIFVLTYQFLNSTTRIIHSLGHHLTHNIP
jgi:hypothetical protein